MCYTIFILSNKMNNAEPRMIQKQKSTLLIILGVVVLSSVVVAYLLTDSKNNRIEQ